MDYRADRESLEAYDSSKTTEDKPSVRLCPAALIEHVGRVMAHGASKPGREPGGWITRIRSNKQAHEVIDMLLDALVRHWCEVNRFGFPDCFAVDEDSGEYHLALVGSNVGMVLGIMDRLLDGGFERDDFGDGDTYVLATEPDTFVNLDSPVSFVGGVTDPNAPTTYAFREGEPVAAQRHRNPDRSLGGWVADSATVAPTATVGLDALVYDTAAVKDDARVEGHARVFGNARVSNRAGIGGHAYVYGEALVFDKARVMGDARVFEEASIFGEAWIFHAARVHGSCGVFENAWIFGNADVCGDAIVRGHTQVCGDVCISCGRWEGGTHNGKPGEQDRIFVRKKGGK